MIYWWIHCLRNRLVWHGAEVHCAEVATGISELAKAAAGGQGTFLCSSAILEGNMEKHNVQWFMFEGGLNLTASCEFTKRGDLSKLKPEKGKKKIVGALQCSMFSMRIAWGGADNARRGLLKCWDAVTLRVSEADSIFFPVSFVGLESKLEQVTSSPVDRYGHALLERKDWICQLESWIW